MMLPKISASAEPGEACSDGKPVSARTVRSALHLPRFATGVGGRLRRFRCGLASACRRLLMCVLSTIPATTSLTSHFRLRAAEGVCRLSSRLHPQWVSRAGYRPGSVTRLTSSAWHAPNLAFRRGGIFSPFGG